MRAFALLLLAPLVCIAVECPEGYFNIYGETCVRFLGTYNSWDNARRLCKEDGADLASIHSEEENYQLAVNAPEGDESATYWIGLRCDDDLSGYYWIDGTSVDFNNVEKSGCGIADAYVFNYATTKWEEITRSTEHMAICMIYKGTPRTTLPPPMTTRSPSPTSSQCGDGYGFDEASGQCILLVAERKTWTAAEDACAANNGHLASIHNKQMNDAIRNMAVRNRIQDAMFIGIHLVNGTAEWSDESDLDYSNFDTGMPNGIFGNCGAMQTQYLDGEWASVHCDVDRLPFVCIKQPTCPKNTTYEIKGDIYSPEYPASHSTSLSCEYLIAAETDEFVYMQFTELELVDGDNIQIYDGYDATDPAFTVTSLTSDRYSTKNGNVMKLVFNTQNGSGDRKWHAQFVSSPF